MKIARGKRVVVSGRAYVFDTRSAGFITTYLAVRAVGLHRQRTLGTITLSLADGRKKLKDTEELATEDVAVALGF